MSPVEMNLEARFDAYVAEEKKIEPKDWMPDAYRKTLIRQISQHAHSEIVGMLPEGNWISRAPSLKRKAILLAKVQDEAGHGLYLYSAAETLGVTRDQMLDDLHTGKAKYSSIFNYPHPDMGGHGCRGLAGGRCSHHESSPSVQVQLWPLRTCHGTCLQGRELPPAPRLPSDAQPRAGHARTKGHGARRAEPLVVAVVDDVWPQRCGLPHSAQSMKWNIKRFSNDELRQRFVDMTVPQAELLGLTIPDPDLKWNEARGHYDFGDIQWEEFYNVIKGNGPCNKERLAARVKAHEDGAWVREAANAYAQKQQAKKANATTHAA